MEVHRQNAWPHPRMDLLAGLRAIPGRWVRGGFEHSRWFPGGSRRFLVWERLLTFLAGEVAIDPWRARGPEIAGKRYDCDEAVVGGGPSGIAAANAAQRAGASVILVSRSQDLAESATFFGEKIEPLHPDVRVLLRHEVGGVYRQGSVLLAVPLDPLQPAAVIAARNLTLAIGRRSIPPLVPGHDLPGVMDVPSACRFATTLGGEMGRTVVVGTGDLKRVADALQKRGVTIMATRFSADIGRIKGRNHVRALELRDGTKIDCDVIVHGGPWRTDPALGFQARAAGSLRLVSHECLPKHVRYAGAAAHAEEPIAVSDLPSLRSASVCTCMDVTVGEILDAAAIDGGHPEVVKRRTSCGMGPCQGFPCWELMSAVLSAQGYAIGSDRPSYRAPRRSITVDQAAGVDGLLELDP
jgi:NAD(P)H-nitrite reductase large subunit